jgi:hypothetical protein
MLNILSAPSNSWTAHGLSVFLHITKFFKEILLLFLSKLIVRIMELFLDVTERNLFTTRLVSYLSKEKSSLCSSVLAYTTYLPETCDLAMHCTQLAHAYASCEPRHYREESVHEGASI